MADTPTAGRQHGWQRLTCQHCGAGFDCGVDRPVDSPCWCAALPPLSLDRLPAPAADRAHTAAEPARCICPDCLKAALAGQPFPATKAPD